MDPEAGRLLETDEDTEDDWVEVRAIEEEATEDAHGPLPGAYW